MAIRIIKVYRMYNFMFLELKLDSLLPECFLGRHEVGPVYAEGEMMNGQTGRQWNVRIIGLEKRYRSISDPNDARKISPNIFIEAFQSKQFLIPLHRSLTANPMWSMPWTLNIETPSQQNC